jgi:HlyD family type I secretion membrane fusion protein
MPETIRNEQHLFASRRQKRLETIKILSEQIAQKKSILAEQTAKVRNLQTELNTASKQYALVKKLVNSGAASTNRMLDAEGKVNRFNTELSSLTRTIPVTRSELGEVTGRLQETLATQKNELLEELHKATLESNQLAERLKADRDMIIRTDLGSPVKGIVNRIAVHTIGGIVRPGEIMAEITPIDEKVIVEARIAPEHRAKIWNSQRVKVKITAFAYATYGTVGGNILDISADSLIDDQTGTSYYRVKIALDRTTVGEGKKIMPGMMTEVNILTGKRTVLDYLLRPLIRVSEQAFSEG